MRSPKEMHDPMGGCVRRVGAFIGTTPVVFRTAASTSTGQSQVLPEAPRCSKDRKGSTHQPRPLHKRFAFYLSSHCTLKTSAFRMGPSVWAVAGLTWARAWSPGLAGVWQGTCVWRELSHPVARSPSREERGGPWHPRHLQGHPPERLYL